MSTENSYKSSPFWEHYHSVVLNHAIPEARAEWYLKWAQRFALSAPGTLKNRSAEQVNAFLDNLAGQEGIEEWQVIQASEAFLRYPSS